MRVAINAWFWEHPTTGSGQYTRHLVNHLHTAASDVAVVLVAPEERAPGVAPPIPGVQVHRATTRPRLPDNLHKVWFEQITFPRVCRRLGVDVAHVPYWAPPLHPTVPTVVTIHDLIPLLLPEYRGGLLVRLYTALAARAARKATLVLTDSHASRRDIVAHLSVPESRIRTIYLAAGERYTPHPSPDDAAIRARHGLPERYVLYLGGFDVRKNVATVLEAYRRARPTIGHACPLVIAGHPPERDSAFAPDPRRLAREQGLDTPDVHFVDPGGEEEKLALYRGALVFVFPSRYEGFGLPPLEALACGTPVVGSATASLPEVVGDAGVLLPPDDAQGMAEALIRLATDDGFRAEMHRRARAQASCFSWERAARETLDAYRDAQR